MIKITIQYAEATVRGFVVSPKHYAEITGADFTEALSKFILAVAQLQETLHEEELDAITLAGKDDDIPF